MMIVSYFLGGVISSLLLLTLMTGVYEMTVLRSFQKWLRKTGNRTPENLALGKPVTVSSPSWAAGVEIEVYRRSGD